MRWLNRTDSHGRIGRLICNVLRAGGFICGDPAGGYSWSRFVLSGEKMNAILRGPEFLLAGICRRSRGVDVLNRAGGTAEHYWFSFWTGDFAEATLPNRAVTNEAFGRDRAAESRRRWFMVIDYDGRCTVLSVHVFDSVRHQQALCTGRATWRGDA
jgi:hypothetical protein